MTNTVYTSTNTSSQVIDTFVLPTEKVINYKIQVVAGNTTWYSTLDINHDGIQSSEQQYALAKSGIIPLELTVTIANNSGTVNVTPTVIPTTFSIERTVTVCNLYSENTLSGRNIKTDEGIGIYFNGSNNMTVRQTNNNIFTDANVYVTSGVMGPIKNGNITLLDTPINGSVKSIEGDYQLVVSSGQKDNCQSYQLNLTAGKRYILSGNAYYTASDVESYLPERDTGPSRIEVGTLFGENDLGGYIATGVETAFSIVFSTTTDGLVIISTGFGDIGNRLYLKNLQLNEYVPFYTYDQDEGSLYLKWSAVSAGATVFSLNSTTANNRVYVDASNNVYINTLNCGPQQPTNKLALIYNSSGIVASRNGNAVVTSTDTFNKYISNAVFVTTPTEFAYMSSAISNTIMVAMSNV
jgi:hypothetical protein